MNNIDLMNYWIETSNDDYETMLSLKRAKRNTWCLFLGHLVIEKLLKALYAKNNKETPHAPKTHDLLYLAEKMNLIITDKQACDLVEITKFNLNTRYDDYQRAFKNKCTDEYTEEQLKKIEEVRLWLQTLLKQ